MVCRSIGRALGWVPGGPFVLWAALAAAESQPNLSARADSAPSAAPDGTEALPSVPKLELSLPPLPPRAVQRVESPFGPAYWDVMQRLRDWRGAGDGELRLTIETGSFEAGGFRLSAGITSIPEHERACAPSCTGTQWSSSVILRYPVGNVGVLSDVGPEIELGGKLGGAREGSPGMMKAGVGGSF